MQENAKGRVFELTNGERPLDAEMWSHSSTAASTPVLNTQQKWTPQPTTRSSLTWRVSRSLTRWRRSPWTSGGFIFPHFPPTDTTQRWRPWLPRLLTRLEREPETRAEERGGETNKSAKTDEEDGEISKRRRERERKASLKDLSEVFEVIQLRKFRAVALERD